MREPHEWAVRKDIAARRLHGMLGRMFRASVVRDAADGSGLARYFDVGRRLQRGEWSERRGEWQRCWPMLRMTGGGGVCGEKCSRLRHNTVWEVRQCKCSHAPTTCSPAQATQSRLRVQHSRCSAEPRPLWPRSPLGRETGRCWGSLWVEETCQGIR